MPTTEGPLIPIGHLADVASTYGAWQRAKEREEASRALFREAVLVARDQSTLQAIAAELGLTRQAVHRIVRDAERDADRLELEARRYDPDNARRALGRSSGWGSGPPQCGGCKRFLPNPDAQCTSCGYMAGGGYHAVPAQTSHLERYR